MTMPYVVTLATQETRDLVVGCLRAAADQRARVARKASSEVAIEKRAGKDVRSSAVKVTTLLAEADDLANLADQLAAAPELPIVSVVRPTVIDAATGAPAVVGAGEDDGTSPAAQAAAELAGLTPADPDAVEDPLTGALPEDEPATVEDVTL
jgi:hypothetical protein